MWPRKLQTARENFSKSGREKKNPPDKNPKKFQKTFSRALLIFPGKTINSGPVDYFSMMRMKMTKPVSERWCKLRNRNMNIFPFGSEKGSFIFLQLCTLILRRYMSRYRSEGPRLISGSVFWGYLGHYLHIVCLLLL